MNTCASALSRTFPFWDRATLKLIAEFDFARASLVEAAYPFVVQTEQPSSNMAIVRLEAANVEVRWSAPGAAVTWDAESATVDVTRKPGRRLCDRRRRRTQHRAQGQPTSRLKATPATIYICEVDFQAAGARAALPLLRVMSVGGVVVPLLVAGAFSRGCNTVVAARAASPDAEALSGAAGVRAGVDRVFYVPERERDYLHLNLYAVHQRVAKSFRQGPACTCVATPPM